jgi:hypothetical protein
MILSQPLQYLQLRSHDELERRNVFGTVAEVFGAELAIDLVDRFDADLARGSDAERIWQGLKEQIKWELISEDLRALSASDRTTRT